MVFDATFWVAISFVIFFGILVYFKIPQNVNSLLGKMILERSISRGNPLEVELVILTNVDSVKINFQEKNEKSLSLL